MDITNMPEPLPVSGPRPAIPRVKMLGNITELKSPTRMMLHMAKWPVLSTDVITRMKDATAAAPSTVPERSFCSKAEPMNLRSEERRVGKEGRCRWAPEQEK